MKIGDKVSVLSQTPWDYLENGFVDTREDIGRIYSFEGDEVLVDWDFIRDGQSYSELCRYYIKDFVWNDAIMSWCTASIGHTGH